MIPGDFIDLEGYTTVDRDRRDPDHPERTHNPEAMNFENNVADINAEALRGKLPSGVPEHKIRLKVGAIMMVTTNVSIADGVCNGTRVMIVRARPNDNTVACLIMTGTHAGEIYQLPRVQFKWGGDPQAVEEGAIRFTRTQFPLRPGAVMTINKSQGILSLRLGFVHCFFRPNSS